LILIVLVAVVIYLYWPRFVWSGAATWLFAIARRAMGKPLSRMRSARHLWAGC